MKFIVLGRHNGKRVLNWPLVFVWVLLLALAAVMASVLILVVGETTGYLVGRDSDLLWFPLTSILLALLLCFVLPFWFRWRKPVDQLPNVEATSRYFHMSTFSVRSILQRVVFASVCLVTLITLLYAFENWRGRRSFQNHKRTVEAKGDTLEWKTFIPPAVPDEQNLAMIPLLKGLHDYERTPKGIVWHDQSSAARLKKFDTIFQQPRKGKPDPGTGSLDKNQLISLSGYQAFFQQNTNLPQPAPDQSPADYILRILNSLEPELRELKTAAATRPLARFPVHYEDNIACLLPHFARLKPTVRYLNLHATACLELGREDEAFEDLKLAFALSDSIRSEPFLISQLFRISCLAMSTQIVKEGLVRHRWTDTQLQWIQDRCGKSDLLADTANSLKAERAFCIAGLDLIRRGEMPARVVLSTDDESAYDDFFRSPVATIYPSGWYYQNMRTVSEYHERCLLTAIDPQAHRVYQNKAESADPILARTRTTPFNVFAKLFTPALLNATLRSARWQTALDQASIACALERYRLAHKKWPEALDDLQPAIAAQLPTDVINGRAYRYEKDGDNYLLYSVGWNEQDDDGRVAAQEAGKGVNIKKGDWVWSLTPTPPIKMR